MGDMKAATMWLMGTRVRVKMLSDAVKRSGPARVGAVGVIESWSWAPVVDDAGQLVKGRVGICYSVRHDDGTHGEYIDEELERAE